MIIFKGSSTLVFKIRIKLIYINCIISKNNTSLIFACIIIVQTFFFKIHRRIMKIYSKNVFMCQFMCQFRGPRQVTLLILGKYKRVN